MTEKLSPVVPLLEDIAFRIASRGIIGKKDVAVLRAADAVITCAYKCKEGHPHNLDGLYNSLLRYEAVAKEWEK
jgi:hypothetical protein